MSNVRMFDYSHPTSGGITRDEFDVDYIYDTVRWCREYSKQNTPGIAGRFSIGIYQIYQALEWYKKGVQVNAHIDSVGSAFIHLVGAAEMCGCDTAGRLTENHRKFYFSALAGLRFDAEETLFNLSRAQQQIYYITHAPAGTVRKARIKLDMLGHSVVVVVRNLFGLVLPEKRAEGIKLEMELLNRAAWKNERLKK